MIVDFSVQNFHSIKNLETLAMNAASIVSRNNQLEATNLIPFSKKLSLLKTKAIYGANASGKSSMIQALSRFMNIIVNSVKDESVLSSLDSFRLSDETNFAPTYFQLTFIHKNILYRYGFESFMEEVRSEWLYGTPGKKEVPFFTREGQEIKINENQFQEGAKVVGLYKDAENDIARKNSLFLSVVRSFNQGLAREIVDYFGGYIIISGLSDYYMHVSAQEYIGDDDTRRKMAEMLKLADTGIEDVTREEYEKENPDGTKEKRYRVVTKHKGFDKDGNISKPVDLNMFIMESEGTKKMFEISPAIFQSLEQGSVLIIDEFDARFHPLLSRKIVELFNSPSNLAAQFIFATHDTNLLSPQLLRRDQICFVEKDKQGASHFYSLADFKGVRNDASYEKDYIAGRYGAIPFLGDFQTLLEK
jgi:AAA15 family ATPase/GTPase